MLDTAIIGGGLCGVVLAGNLHRQGRSVALFEARERLGGRILTVAGADSRPAMDLGPTWFWPETQPLLKHLIAELGLAAIPQHDDGSMLHLNDPDKVPERIDGKYIHEGAHRLQHGMAQLVAALAAELPSDLVRLGHVLTHVSDRTDHIVLTFTAGGDVIEIEARHVVLAAPPRLLAEHVRFEPELDDATRDAMTSAETWMASQAKVIIGYERPFWREAGQSGNAFVTHEQAVIGEIFDACDDISAKGALGGFLALSPELRDSFSTGLPILMDNQMMQVFGTSLEGGEQHYQDWASETFTCSTSDRDSATGKEHVGTANPMLRRTLWDGKLYLGGSETASRGAGYLEGALEAAQRIERALDRVHAGADALTPLSASDGAASINAASLARFKAWVAAQTDAVFDDYRRRLNRSLAVQQRDQLTQLAILESMEEVFRSALAVLDDLAFDMSAATVDRGRSSLMPDIQQPFGVLMQSLIDDVTAFNRTSCALSNFPDEHRLSKEYTQVIMRDIAAAWQEFSLSANRMLLAKADAGNRCAPAAGLTSVSP